MVIIAVTVVIMASMLIMVTAIIVATIMVAILVAAIIMVVILMMIMVTVPVSSPDLYQRTGLESRGFVAAATEYQRADHQTSDNAFHDRNLWGSPGDETHPPSDFGSRGACRG